MLNHLLRLAASTATTATSEDPSMMVVVVTGLVLVFAILVLLYALLTLEGKLFVNLDKKRAEKKTENTAEINTPVNPAPVLPVAPQIEAGIPPEVVAAIAAAVASIEGGKYTLRAVNTQQRGRGQWGLAGVISYTEPF